MADRPAKAFSGRPFLPKIICAFAALVLAGCGEDERPGGADRPRVVIVETLRPFDGARRPVVLPGRIEAVTQAELSFQADGQVRAIHVEEGQPVRSGDVLAELDDTDYRVQLRQAQTAEETAVADLTRRRALNAEGILAPAAVEEAEANAAQARGEREMAERQLSYTRLTAPYDGVVGRRMVEVGAVTGTGNPVMTMVDARAIDVAVDLPATEAVRLPLDDSLTAIGHAVGIGQEVEIALGYQSQASVPDEQSRTYRLLFRGAPPQGLTLLPGMAVRVIIADPSRGEPAEGEFAVPVSALFSEPEGRDAVWVVGAEGRVAPVTVEVLEIVGDRARIAGGMDERALVVVAGARQLQPDQTVRPRMRD